MILKKTLKNGNDSVLLYYFVQCTLKGKKKKIVFWLKTLEREHPLSTTVLYGSPTPSPLWPSGLWERECCGSYYLYC